MIRRTLIAPFIQWLGSILLSTACMADAEPNTLYVGVFSAPPSIEVIDGETTGFTVSLARQIIHQVSPNAKIEFVSGTIPRLIRELEQGNLDLAYLLNNKRFNSNVVAISQAFQRETELWSLPSNPIHPGASLKKSKVAALNHNTQIPMFSGIEIFSVNNTGLLIPMLTSGRVDAVYSFSRSLNYHAFLNGWEPQDFARTQISTVPVYLWTHKNSAVFENIQQWRIAAQEIHTLDNDRELWQRYLNSLRARQP